MSSEEKATIDTKLVKFLCGCNIPFEVLDSTHFKSLISSLRPAYETPSTKKVNNNLLTSVYDKLVEAPSTFPQSDGILMISEMKSQGVESKNVFGIVRRTSDATFFLKVWSIPRNETDITDIVNETIQISEEKFNVNIYAVIATEDLSLTSNPNDVWFFTCQTTIVAKVINIFTNLQFISEIRSVLEAFQTPRLKDEVINSGGFEIEVAKDEVSIVAVKDMLTTCLKNECIFYAILSENVFNVPEHAVRILSSSATSFKEKLRKFIAISEQFCSLSSECELPSSTMCDMTERWLRIESLISGDGSFAEIDGQIRTIVSPLSIVANYFHPAYRGLTFESDPERNVIVLDYLLTVLNDKGLDEYYEFSKKTGLFEKIETRQIKDPEKYWDFATKKYPNLSKIAKKMIRVPASVARVKLQPFTDNTVENDRKMVELYYRLKLQDQNITDKY